MRDLARYLGLSPGNLTYHFPKKEDIIIAIAERLSDLNSQTLQTSQQPEDLKQFLEMFQTIFRNQFQYRCLVLSLVHLTEHYPAYAVQYRETQAVRTGSFQEKLIDLQGTGFLKEEVSEVEIQRLAAYCTLIGRFWLSEYWVSYRDRPVEKMIGYYLNLLAGVFIPYVTAKGYQDLTAFLIGARLDL